MTRRKGVSASRRSDFAPTVEQRTNALKAAALQAAQKAKRKPPELDWDAMIARLHTMLDALEN